MSLIIKYWIPDVQSRKDMTIFEHLVSSVQYLVSISQGQNYTLP